MDEFIKYYVTSYTCEKGALAKIIIPENATEDDIQGLYDFLNVIAKRRFKVNLQGGGKR